MSAADERAREEQALEALIVSAIRREDCDEEDHPGVAMPDTALDDDDRQALDALGPGLVSKIISGAWRPRSDRPRSARPGASWPGPQLAGSMHRGDDESELTDRAREEIERKIRELGAEGGGATET